MNTRVIDWFMATVAVMLLAWMMASQTTSSENPTINVMDIRQLELQPRLWDAQQAFPEEVRSAIGLVSTGDGDAETADPLASAKEIVREVQEEVDRRFDWSFPMRSVAIAIAIGLGENESALRQIRATRDRGELSRTEQDVIGELKDLAQGASKPTFATLQDHLKSLGISSWLELKLEARHHQNGGDTTRSDELIAQANTQNTPYVGQMTVIVLTTTAFFILGMLLLIGFPWFSKMLHRRGHTGLVGTCSPFEGQHTLRVLAAWFLFYACSHVVISLVMVLLEPFVSRAPLSIATVSLLHGGASLILIQTFGRKEGDNRSLGECLRFRYRDSSGGVLAFGFWILGGFALTVAIAIVGVAVNEMLLGDELSRQSSVQLFAEAQGTPDLVILVTAVCVFAPVFEEILFRGFLYRNLRDRFGPWIGLVLSSFLFAVAHVDMSNMLPLFAIGCAFGLSYERSGSLWIPIIIHALWNLSTVVRILGLLG